MRLVKVSAPQGKASELLKIAFACGISELSVHAVQQHKPGSDPVVRDVIDAQVSTPEAAAFVEALVNASFFNRRDYAIEVREPRSILKSTKTRKITRPVPAPVLDIDQELWQFTHVTYSFVVRVFVAALLLSYGLVEDNPLFIIGGLVFLPFMPIVLAFSYGLMTRQWAARRARSVCFGRGYLARHCRGARGGRDRGSAHDVRQISADRSGSMLLFCDRCRSGNRDGRRRRTSPTPGPRGRLSACHTAGLVRHFPRIRIFR
jgi:hypothetical protein